MQVLSKPHGERTSWSKLIRLDILIAVQVFQLPGKILQNFGRLQSDSKALCRTVDDPDLNVVTRLGPDLGVPFLSFLLDFAWAHKPLSDFTESGRVAFLISLFHRLRTTGQRGQPPISSDLLEPLEPQSQHVCDNVSGDCIVGSMPQCLYVNCLWVSAMAFSTTNPFPDHL